MACSFEVGGTSTDISCVKDGKVMIKYAEVGGHKTYLNSLDVRTVGIGGGSMVEVKDGKACDTGPRSAHIAGLDYEVFTDADKIQNPRLVPVSPMPGDPEYASIECDNGVRVCLYHVRRCQHCGLRQARRLCLWQRGSRPQGVEAAGRQHGLHRGRSCPQGVGLCRRQKQQGWLPS